jgi:hypothetical protein
MNYSRWSWAGVFGGAFFWYAAHDLSLYFSAENCKHGWIAPTIHIVALIGAIISGVLSYQAWPKGDDGIRHRRLAFTTIVGVTAAGLFAIVILWQGIATLIYTGCEQ